MKIIFLCIAIIMAPIVIQAQDRIIKTDKTIITVKIIEIGEAQIKYRSFSNQEGPLFTINISTVHKIILESGDEFEYNPLIGTSTQTSSNVQTQTRSSVVPANNSTSVSQTDASTRLNDLNTKRQYNVFLNFDIANSENVMGGDDQLPQILLMDVLSFNFMFPMADSDKDENVEASHGIILSTLTKFSNVLFPIGTPASDTQTFIQDIGVGYGYNMGTDIRLYGLFNTAAFAYTQSGDQSNSEFLPSDSGSLRLGAFWTPWGGGSVNWGLHAGFDTYFAEGAENAFVIGFSTSQR